MCPVGAPQDRKIWSLNSRSMKPMDLPAAVAAVGANRYIRLRFTILPTCK
jgi:hypothetical protein